jgi:catechol 2,3-dioxygenase-like lactoylglutathione lyase family enzyme
MAPSLGFKTGFSGFAVPDLDAAKAFYGETLGLDVREEMDGVLRITLPGGADVMVYIKPDHQPAVFTILNFEVDDIDAAVDALTAAGVQFERYEGFEHDDKGIVRSIGGEEGPPIAWFTDPASNIIAVMQTGGTLVGGTT